MKTQMQSTSSSSRSVPYLIDLGSTSVKDSIQAAKAAIEDSIPGVSAEFVETCDSHKRQKKLDDEERMQKGLVHNFRPAAASADGLAKPQTTAAENEELLNMLLEEKLVDFGYMVSSRLLSGPTAELRDAKGFSEKVAGDAALAKKLATFLRKSGVQFSVQEAASAIDDNFVQRNKCHLNSDKALQKRAQRLVAAGALKLRDEHPLLCALLGHYTELL